MQAKACAATRRQIWWFYSIALANSVSLLQHRVLDALLLRLLRGAATPSNTGSCELARGSRACLFSTRQAHAGQRSALSAGANSIRWLAPSPERDGSSSGSCHVPLWRAGRAAQRRSARTRFVYARQLLCVTRRLASQRMVRVNGSSALRFYQNVYLQWAEPGRDDGHGGASSLHSSSFSWRCAWFSSHYLLYPRHGAPCHRCGSMSVLVRFTPAAAAYGVSTGGKGRRRGKEERAYMPGVMVVWAARRNTSRISTLCAPVQRLYRTARTPFFWRRLGSGLALFLSLSFILPYLACLHSAPLCLFTYISL